MKKLLTDYRWFDEMRRADMHLYAGRKFYATLVPCRSCKNCQFENKGGHRCEINVELELGINKPITVCIPCKSTRHVGRGDIAQGDALRTLILEKCEHEEGMDAMPIPSLNA